MKKLISSVLIAFIGLFPLTAAGYYTKEEAGIVAAKMAVQSFEYGYTCAEVIGAHDKCLEKLKEIVHYNERLGITANPNRRQQK